MNPAIIAAGIGLAGDFLGGVLGGSAQKKANKANIALQKDNQAWMERMSNTSWTRGVEDMKAAGLNPMLAVAQGGASSPSSSAATVNPEDAWQRAAHSASGKALQYLSAEQAISQIGNVNQDTRQKKYNADIAEVNRDIAKAGSSYRIATEQTKAAAELQMLATQIQNAKKQGELTNAQARQLTEMLPELHRKAQADADLAEAQVPSAKAEAELYTDLDKNTGFFGEALEKVIKLRKAFK